MTTPHSTLWVADRRARPQGLIADLRRRHGERSIARLAPAAACGSALSGARLAILDLRSGSGLDRTLLPEIAAALLAHGCAALMLADEPGGGAVAPAELAATYRAAVVATQAVAASRARLARSWMPAAGRPAIATTLADSRVLGANAELLELLGIERLEELLGRPLNAFLAEPEGAAAAPCGANDGSSPGMEVEIWRRGGERVPALRFGRTLRRPRSAAVVGCEVAFVELPAASAVRRALAASEQRYRRLVDSLPDGVVQCDAGGTVEVWNPAAERIFGLVGSEVVGRSWIGEGWELLREDGSPIAREDLPLARTLRTGEPATAVVIGVRPPGGAVRWLSVNSRSLGGGSVPGSLGAVASFSDVTERKLLAEQLVRLQREEQMILDSVPAFIWFKDRENRVRRINRYAAAVLGLAEETIAGQSTYDLYPRNADAYYRDDLEVMSSGIAKLGIIERLETPSGGRLWLQTSKVPHFDDRGAVDGVIVLAIDVTARHRAEEQLLLLESVVEQTREGILVWQAQSRRIVYVNPAVLANTGYRRDELLGQPATLLLEATPGSPEAAWIEGRVDQGEALHAEIPCRMANGTTRLLDLRIEPLRGSGGEITHWAALGRDRTAHKAAQEERDRLRETISRSLLEWHQTFDSIALPVLLLDARGAVGRLNEAARQLAGRSFAECLQEPLDRLGRGEPWAAAARLTAAVRRTGTLASRGEQCTSDGRTWEIRAQPLPTGGGIIVTLHDLSDLVALQESLRRSATMSAMGMLVAGVAHEVRNPLFGLGALLDTFESQAEPRQPFPVEPFRRGLTRLQNLMQQLLDYGQPAPLSRSPHSLFKTLAESLDTCRSLATERQVDLALCADPRLPMACIDESRMLQVFSNLVDNAIRYSPCGGRVTVSAAAAGQWVECDVEDAGPGVAAEDLASIFEPFFSRRRGGTGLGLAIVQKIVVDHGGTIACHDRDGGGTRMTVRLPVAAST